MEDASRPGFPDDLIGKVWVDVRAVNPKVVYAQVEATGAKGGLYRSDDSGATWTLVNSSQRLRARPFYFNKVFVNPKDENEVYVTELGFHKSTDGGKTFTTIDDAARRQPRRLDQSGQPEDHASRPTTAARTSRRTAAGAGRRS